MPRVLIVDDDETDLLLLESMLESEHEILTAGTGEDALRIYRTEDVDVVVTDIQMPRGDGIELIKAIKRLDPTTPIIAISGQRPHKLGIALMEGATLILSKPLNPVHLQEAVARAARGEGGAE